MLYFRHLDHCGERVLKNVLPAASSFLLMFDYGDFFYSFVLDDT